MTNGSNRGKKKKIRLEPFTFGIMYCFKCKKELGLIDLEIENYTEIKSMKFYCEEHI